MQTRIFIDFWNFTIQWNDRHPNKVHPDWRKVPGVFHSAAQAALTTANLGPLLLAETRVYASYEPGKDETLRRWLNNFLDRQTGVRVFTTERRWAQRPVHCRFCDQKTTNCQSCGKPLGRAAEKAVDAWIVTDLMNLAWAGAYEVAILVSCDKDFLPAITCLQDKNFRIINAQWSGFGNELAAKCWGSFSIDPLVKQMEQI